jgi:small subunit ribosomal protein S1
VYDDINGLVHLSEITSDKKVDNPSQALRLGQVVQAKVILLEPHNRKIGLSIKALNEDADADESDDKKEKKEKKKKKTAK